MNANSHSASLRHLPLLMAACAIAYPGAMDTPFVLDDFTHIVNNPIIRDFGVLLDPAEARRMADPWQLSLYAGRFVSILSLALNYSLSGLSAGGYHLFNLLIHMIASAALYLLGIELLSAPRMKGVQDKAPIAFAAALIFALHPVQTQAVTYVVQRMAGMAGAFYLISVLLYLKARNGGGAMPYAASLCFALMAYFSKETALTLPLALVLTELVFFGPAEIKGRLKAIAPYLLIAFLVPLAHSWAGSFTLPRGAEVSRAGFLMTEGRAVFTYLRLIFLPINQSLEYDYPSVSTPLYAIGAGVLALAGACLARGNPARAALGFGILWFLLTLSVESTFVTLSPIYEHRLYIPLAGLAFGLATASSIWIWPHWRARSAIMLALAFLLALATFSRNEVWGTEASLWSDVVNKAPQKPRGHANLALALWGSGDLAGAVAQMERAIELEPRADLYHYDLGLMRLAQGRIDLARQSWLEALRLRPGHSMALNQLGTAAFNENRLDEAAQYYSRAIEALPSNAEAHYNLALVLERAGQPLKAREHYRAFISLAPPGLEEALARARQRDALITSSWGR